MLEVYLLMVNKYEIINILKDISPDNEWSNTDNIMDGIDSFTVVRLIIEIEEKFGITFPIEKFNLSELQTIDAVCQVINELLV